MKKSDLLSIVLLTLLFLSLACSRSEPLRFSVVFENAGGLERGDRVYHRDVEVGKVTSVSIDEQGMVRAEVEVEDRYRTAVSRDSVIRIDRHGLRRRTRLTIEDDATERSLVREGEVLAGSEGVTDDILDQLKEAAQQTLERVGDAASDLQTRLRELPDSPEAQELAAELRRLGADAAERGREGAERFRSEQLPELEERAKAIRRQLEDKGFPEQAEKFWNDFESWLASKRKSLGPDPGPPAELERSPP